MAATDASGFPTAPAANELIESAWGVAVRKQLVVSTGHTFVGSPGFANGTRILTTQVVAVRPFITWMVAFANWTAGGGTVDATWKGWVHPQNGGTDSPGTLIHFSRATNWASYPLTWSWQVPANLAGSFDVWGETFVPSGICHMSATVSYLQVVA